MTAESFKIPRNWWGKIIGAMIGLFRGGLTGAILGALLGHIADRFIATVTGVGTTRDSFFQALFCSLGHLSKADGQVTPAEIRTAESLMASMRISGDERQTAIAFFNQGKQPDFKLEVALQAFVQHSAMRMDLRQMFVQILVDAAFTSGRITSAEQSVLQRIARELKIPQQVFAAMMFARQGGAGAQQEQHSGSGVIRPSLDQAYAQLGLKSTASDTEIKKAYRKLVSQYHPDKLVSRGLPEEMMEMAKTRVREINVAYDQIKDYAGVQVSLFGWHTQ